MLDVLRGSLTRRMLALFLGVAFGALLVFGVISATLRFENQNRQARMLEAELSARASEQVLAQARSTADALEQMLGPRTAVAVLLAEHGQRLYEAGHAAALDEGAAAAIDWGVKQDKAVRSAFVSLQDGADLVTPSYTGNLDHQQLFADWMPQHSPASGEPADIAWRLAYTGQGTVLVVAAPIWSGNQMVGIAGLELWADRVIEDAPRDSLVGPSSLLLISSEGRFAALQSWGYSSFRWSRLPPLAFKAGRPLTEFLPADAARALDSESFHSQLRQGDAVVMSVELEDQSAFMAFQTVGGTPLTAVLVVPLSAVWSLAQSYGAPLHVAILPTVIELFVVAIALLLAVSLGAVTTLRQIAQPIRELSNGANAIMRGKFTHRVPQEGPEELKGLAESFNHMAEVVGMAQGDLESKQAQLSRTLATRQMQFEIINEVAVLANQKTDLGDKLTNVLRVVCTALNVDEGAVVLSKADNTLVSLAQQTRNSTDPRPLPLAARRAALVQRALTSHSVVQECAPSAGAVSSGGWCVAVPFELGAAEKGAIVLEYAECETPGLEVVAFLNALATHIAVLVDSAHLQSELRYVVLSEERRRMARELHDSVTQTIFTLSLAAEGLKAGLEEVRPEVVEALDFLIAQAGRARQEMRGLINELRPIDLGAEGLDQAIRVHAASVQRATGLRVTTRIEGDMQRLSPLIQHNMNRVLQEILSNVMRHARARNIHVQLTVEETKAELRVVDDGEGFDVHRVGAEQLGSMGLISMRERSEAMGGTLSIDSTIGCGTTVIARVPLQPPGRRSTDE